ncbi:twin-arginine translocation signal domain-containing protein [Sutterella faecalis]|uniref:Twin-arginine translocation signal domain-containing protein n=1 Tax=Sutterella faecalis TaxID=2584944 RepID=A0ABX5VCB3_9BURK|nr:molybdopterin-dependent oxidoreductase [Sutterella faecalis]QDA53836.1 twin-arginine translocation signal domain-containing protein [Sutterella faecalis]
MTKNVEPSAARGPGLSRRSFIGAAGAVGAAAGTGTIGAAVWTAADEAIAKEVEALKAEGWEAHPTACMVCGGYCGLLALHKKGEPVSQATVKIMPNPTHPQRGCCARGAQAMWVWNHPQRLKKPLKRTGERGEGKFEEISWDQALTEIAERVKKIVEEHGERAISMTSHNFSGLQQWLAAPLGTPNVISHSSTCNSASVAGRRMVFGKGFDGAGKVEPDYERCRLLLCVGRSLNCAMGVAAVFGRSREKGAKVIFVDPRMPENAMSSGAEWVPIRPGTDSAFLLSMIGIGITEKLVDFEFLRRYTNAPYLIEVGTHRPITADELIEGASKDAFVVMNRASSAFAAMGLARDEKGAVKGYDEPEGVDPDLDYAGTVRTVDGRDLSVETAFVRFSKTAIAWTPEKASLTTGIPSETIVRIARAFFTEGGVCDDGWYASRNGNDSPAFALMSMINLFTGQIDQPGGFVVTQGGGFKGPAASQSGGKGKGPHGESWKNAEGKALDKVIYPEGSGTYSAIFSAIEEGKPYPIRAAFITGSTMFHREANSDRMAKAFRALELMVVQDIFPHEVIDYADYVLPSTFFLEGYEYGGVKWALNGNVQLSNAGIEPPEGCDAREEIWQFCEILRRAFPERAKERLGYDHEMKTREEFKNWYRGMMDSAWAKFIAKKNSEKPGEGDRIDADVKARGWSQVSAKKFGVYPQKKPFGTPTGKGEIISFLFAGKYEKKGASGLSNWVMPPAYTIPRPRSNEFYLVSGKDSASNSGVAMWTWPSKFLGDRTVWMNPVDAERLGIRTGDTVELTSLDTGVKGRTQVTVTNRVVAGSLFAHGFAGGVRTKRNLGAYEWTREGINSHWFCTGYREPVTGSLANNSTVRVERI